MNATKQQIDAIFFTALNLPEEGRRRDFLEQACAGDGSLRATVDKMLSAHSATEDFFAGNSPALALTAEDFQEVENESFIEDCSGLDERIGSRIGRYKLVQRLGEGGWGVVYVAEQEMPIRRRVAVKIIKPGMDTKSVIARFQTECQTLAMMDHPDIARVLDAGATENGRPYFVMELVTGVKITQFCDQNKLTLQERLALFVRICQAVQHAHQKGIIHRDIKPSNILVTLHGGVPTPKIIDFGIAKAIEGRLTDKTLSTTFERAVGTPAYMSPEQADSSGLDVDTRSDIYSLGVLLYELLTGRTPFDPKELMKSGLEGMRRMLREVEPPRPSAMLSAMPAADLKVVAENRGAEAQQLISLLKGDLDWVVMKALEKERDRRYETADGLAMDLRRYLNTEPVIACPPSRLYRFQKLVRRNKVVFAAAATVALALVLGLGAASWLFILEREAEHEQNRLRLEAENARANEARLREQAEMRERLTRVVGFLKQKNVDEADALLDQTSLPLVEPSQESAVALRSIGEFYAVSGRWRRAADCFVALMRMNHLESTDVTTAVYDSLLTGSCLLECGDTAGYQRFRKDLLDRFAGTTNLVTAEQLLKANLLASADEDVLRRVQPWAGTLEQWLAHEGSQSRDGTSAWRELSLELMAYRQGHFTNAFSWGQKCIQSSESNPARIVAGHSLMAMSYYQLGQHEQALAELAYSRKMVEARFAQPFQAGQGYLVQGSWCAWVIARRLTLEATSLMGESLEPAGQESEALPQQ